jgi:hypothetical protein
MASWIPLKSYSLLACLTPQVPPSGSCQAPALPSAPDCGEAGENTITGAGSGMRLLVLRAHHLGVHLASLLHSCGSILTDMHKQLLPSTQGPMAIIN